ncbi:HU family DNA-binding protein [Clostridium sp. MD294]|uniref:HU family DNA-binding protein n=1 Tax=Clostridium sp. MD294 TaxID=97138 RepID=UPI0002C90E85|nr:HU family DNA-binding protein [Clostridium sp. MD294]NDO46623.1 HU family DNA-binding protein [Clostridium sp. MD294]USF28944.1 DNA-binding protein HU [Clostridium sp. MD294]
MNKSDLVAAMAEKAEMSKKDAEKALKAFEEVVTNELAQDGKVQLVGFGTFEVVERAAREGRNPKTGEPMPIPASKAPRFKAGKALKDAINKE